MPWLVVLDPGDWEVIPTKAVSPLHTFLLRERHLGDRMGIALAQRGRPQPTLHWAARHCYWDLGKSQLLQLTTHRGLSCTAKSSLFEIVLELVQDVLKPIGLKELDEILSLRAKLVNTVSSEMPVEVFKEVADEEDHQDAKAVKNAKLFSGFLGVWSLEVSNTVTLKVLSCLSSSDVLVAFRSPHHHCMTIRIIIIK